MKLKLQLKYIFFLAIIFNHYKIPFEDFLKRQLSSKKISVIIPIYNSEKFLEECLRSVINQTLKSIEIICIDDGSNDNSFKILEKYNKYDNRFIIIKQKNKGAGFSRNKGIDISKGKYISFLDSDDMYFNDYILELLFEKANKNKAIICGGGIEFMSKINNQTFFKQNIFLHEGFMKYINYQGCSYYQRFIYNKNFLRMNKLHFPNYLRYQDPPFFIKSMALAKNFYSTKNITYIYRETSKKQFTLQQVMDMFSGLNDCLILGERFKLYRIYNTMLNILNNELFVNEAKKYSNDRNLRNSIIKIIKSINYQIIIKNKINFTINDYYKSINNIIL